MEKKFTSKPWVPSTSGGSTIWGKFPDGSDALICSVGGGQYSSPDSPSAIAQRRNAWASEMEKPNRLLIAAAPDLYEALEDIIEQAELTKMMLPPDLADSIRVFGKKALAKANGEWEAEDILRRES